MYTKLTDLKNKITSLIYFNCDFVHPSRLGFGNCLQRCEDNEHKEKLFNRIIFNFGNEKGIKSYLVVNFDFDKELISINNKSFKVIQDFEYIYKKRSNTISAINGIKGLYNHIVYAMAYDSAICYHTLDALEKWFKTSSVKI